MRAMRAIATWTAVLLLVGCSDPDEPGGADGAAGDAGADIGGPGGGDVGGDSGNEATDPVTARGWVHLRTALHVHTVHSHDACDGDPKPGGEPNGPCTDDLRRGICSNGLDVVFATDHDGSMAEVPFAELLLPYQLDGDVLEGPAEAPTALRMACEGGGTSWLVPGAENDLMPIGLRRHPTPAEGQDLHGVYNATDVAAVEAWKAAGATVFVSHAEEWETEGIAAIPVDGIETYNVHAALDPRRGGLAALGNVSAFLRGGEGAPDTNLVFLGLYGDMETNLTHWARLTQRRRVVGAMAHDVHQNVLPTPYGDGDRFDSYRRILGWFSNHVLATERSPAAAQVAIAEGRSFAVIDVAGSPRGFDAWVTRGDGVCEMGVDCAFEAGMALHALRPEVADLPEGVEAPGITVRVVEMMADGTATVVQEADGDVQMAIDHPGVFRVDVSLVPRHLLPRLPGAEDLAARPLVWIRTNPFYVRGG